MEKIKIKNVLISGKIKDILISEGKFQKIKRNIKEKADIEVKEKKLAAFPIFFNMHTHLSMTLFRGIGDDLPLKKWLRFKIWPRELLLNEKKIKEGSEIGVRELKRTGCAFFCDMYWFPYETAKIVMKHKIGAILGIPFFDKAPLIFSKKTALKNFYQLKKTIKNYPLIKIAIAPHAIYTVSKNNLIWAKEFANKNNLYFHIHLSETKEEVEFCKKKYGTRPVEFLDKLKILDKKTILAHCVHLNDKEIKILGKRKCLVVYCPCSNMKLGVCGTMPFKKLKKENALVGLGTDGPASNNSLDMFEEMKMGALLQKHSSCKPEEIKSKEIFESITKVPAKFLEMKNEIKEGYPANFILIDLSLEEFSKGKDLISHLVYSTNYNCVKYLFFNGNLVYKKGQ